MIYIKLVGISSFVIYFVYLCLDSGFITKEKDKPLIFKDEKIKKK
ncbi:hypothetical protein [Clostridium sp. DL1XJH146]